MPALPASSATLLAHLLNGAPRLSGTTVRRRRAAIAAMHRENGLPVPVLDREGQTALRRSSRRPARPKSARTPTPAALARSPASLPRDLAGLRDRAMLLLLAVAKESRAVTQTALLGLDAEHIRFTASGAELRVRIRADEEEPTLALSLLRSATHAACPVHALEDWLRTSGTAYGPVFRKVDRWGSVEHTRLGPDAWRRILARHAGTARSTRHG